MDTAIYINHDDLDTSARYTCCAGHADGTKRVGPNWRPTSLEQVDHGHGFPCQFCDPSGHRRAVAAYYRKERRVAKIERVDIVKDTRCPRCGGAGKIEAFAHIDGGRCFECGGSGKVD